MVTHLPYSIRFTVLLVILSEHTILFMIPTFIAYMMDEFLRDSVPASDLKSEISFKSGEIEGLNGMVSFIGCLLWSSVSDKIGRKRSLIIVSSGMMVTSIGFGLSTSFEVALCWRIFSGLFAGTIPLTKSLIQDITDSTNIAILYSYLGAGYGIASILGPILGGTLSHPYRLLPSIFDSEFFHTYRYFLPLFAHSLITLSGLLMTIFYLPDKKQPDSKNHCNEAFKGLITNKHYLLGLLAFCLMEVVQFGYRISMSLWVKLGTEDDGLGWSTERNLGLMNASSGIIVTAFHLGVVPILAKRLGVVDSLYLLNLQMLPIIMIIPWLYKLDGVAMWVSLIILNGFSIVSTTAYLSFVSIGASNSVKLSIMGTAMGITQSIVAFIRGLTIEAFGALWGALQVLDLGFPFDHHFPFLLMAVFLIADLLLVITFFDRSIEKRHDPKPEEVALIEKEFLNR